MPMEIPQRITDLLEDHADGLLDAAGRDELAAWFRASEENQETFAQWFLMQAELSENERLAELQQIFGSPVGGAAPAGPSTPSRSGRHWTWLALAASLAAGAFLSQLWTTGSERYEARDSQRRRPRPVEVSSDAAATLSRVANCVWEESSLCPRVGDLLRSGDVLELKSGLAQLSFESGARIVLAGPCKLKLNSPMACRLDIGSLTAEVPREASGFTIRGPAAEVIDLGTSFGFAVEANGSSQVHVFEGEVISRQLDARGQIVGKSILLTQNQAIQFHPGQLEKAEQLAADEAKFIRQVPTLWAEDVIEPLPRNRDLTLWLRADHGAQLDGNGGVTVWQDLALGDNDRSNDALQPQAAMRPKLTRNAIGGRTAVQFDGKRAYLATLPMTTTDNQTVAIVFRYAPFSTRTHGSQQLLNYNGPPSRYMAESRYLPGVLQVGEDVGSRAAQGSVSAKAYAGKIDGRDVDTGWLASGPLGEMTPIVVAYVYDHKQDHSRLFVNGKQVSQGLASSPIAITSRKILGRHGFLEDWLFCGDIAEVVIYNAALPPDEVRSLSGALMAYYGIDTAD